MLLTDAGPRFPRRLAVGIVMPAGAALRVCEKARQEWGAGGVLEQHGGTVTRVLFRTGGSSHFASQGYDRPAGGFTLRWETPAPRTATIEELGWDPTMHGSEAEVRDVINSLAGWPVASP